jgi:hypothetical protein
MGWLIVVVVVVVALAAVFVWSRGGGVRQRALDDAKGRDATNEGPHRPPDGSTRGL